MSYELTIRRLAFIISFIVLVAGGGCEKQDRRGDQEVDQPNILMIMVDALRADHLELYGHFLPTAPFLNKWAKDGFIFNQAFSQASWTNASVASLFSSRYVSSHGLTSFPRGTRGETDRKLLAKHVLTPHAITLAEVLERHDYQTAAFSANPFVAPIFGFSQGFQTYDIVDVNFISKKYGNKVNRSFLKWASDVDPKRPFFAYLHYMDVHGPYKSPRRYRDAFLKDYDKLPGRPLSDKEYRRLHYLKLDTRELNDYKAYYDAQILHWDNLFEELWNRIVSRKLDRNLMVVVLSDHGEAFLEHGRWDHGYTLHREELHVPLIFRKPGVIRTGRSSRRAALIDVAPTLLQMAGIEPPKQFHGMSLKHLMIATADRKPHKRPAKHIVSELTIRIGGHWISFLERKHRWVYNKRRKEIIGVYRVDIDPNEQNNIVDQIAPETIKKMVRRFNRWLRDQRKYRLPPAKLPPDLKLDPFDVKELESLGYIQ